MTGGGHTRRRVLAGLAAATAPLAGCGGSGGEGPSDTPTTPYPDRGHGVVLDPVAPATVGEEATVRVFPENLQRWLSEAVASGRTLWVVGDSLFPVGDPVLTAFGRVRVAGPDLPRRDVRLSVAGGRYARRTLSARRVADPSGRPTPTGDLPPARRYLVAAAAGGEVEVEPQTELGRWALSSFVGSEFRYDGAVYRGVVARSGDPSGEDSRVWYVLSATPAPADGPTLRLGGLADFDRRLFREAVAPAAPFETVDRYTGYILPEPAQEREYLLFHGRLYRLSAY